VEKVFAIKKMEDPQRYSQYNDQSGSAAPVGQPSSSSGFSASGILNAKFILRFVEWLCAVVVFGTAASYAVGAYAFAIFTGVISFLLTMFFMISYLLSNKMGNLNSILPLLEFVIGVFIMLFFLAAGIATAYDTAVLKTTYIGIIPLNFSNLAASSAFCFFSLILWAVSSFLAFNEYRSGRSPMGQSSVSV